MKPGGQIQAVIEILDSLRQRPMPADVFLKSYFKDRRYIGKSDRQEISELLFDAFRHYAMLQARAAKLDTFVTGRPLVLAYLRWASNLNAREIDAIFNGEIYHPRPLSRPETTWLNDHISLDLSPAGKAELPDWIWDKLTYKWSPEKIAEEAEALNTHAPFDIRVNTLKTTTDAVYKQLCDDGIEVVRTAFSPTCLRVLTRRSLLQHPLLLEGKIEIQDEGAQIIGFLADVKSKHRVLDFCAGAGGKTLAMAAIMANKGGIVAADTVQLRLTRARERLRRADVHNTTLRLLDGEGYKWLARQNASFDRVLVDAPCSGSGTWRRNPDHKWRLTPLELEELNAKQQMILGQAAKTVKIGGLLIYATCSILAEENDAQIAQFLTLHPHYALTPIPELWASVLSTSCPSDDPMLSLTPSQHGTDGFFVAVLKRITK